MKSILDRSFRYTPSVQTDVKKTFARIRREQQSQQHAPTQANGTVSLNVSPIRRSGSPDTGSWRSSPGKR